jgi:hypothetical protein
VKSGCSCATVSTRGESRAPKGRGAYMDITAVTQLITSVGFPICMSLILCYYIKYQTDVHKEESKELTTAIDSLREIINEIKVKLEGE